MYQVEMYLRLRRACMVEGMSVREASRVFGLHRDTVRKMLEYSVPPGYRRESPPRKPKLEAFTGVIDAILEGDTRVPRKQRLSRASTKRTTAAEECCTTWVMPDGHGLAGGVGGSAWTVGPALARR